jgi:hypothetical protein
MNVTKTYSSATTSSTRTESDGKDFDAKEGVHFETNCGVGAYNPVAIYIRPFCIAGTTIRGDEAPTEAGVPLRASLIPVAFAGDLKDQLSKIAPTMILHADETPKVGWLVEGQFDSIDGGSPLARFFFGAFGAGQSTLALHLRVTDAQKHRVVYEFDLAGGSHDQGHWGTVRASGLGSATPFDLRNAAERVYLVLSPDAFRYGARTTVTLR